MAANLASRLTPTGRMRRLPDMGHRIIPPIDGAILPLLMDLCLHGALWSTVFYMTFFDPQPLLQIGQFTAKIGIALLLRA